MDYATWEVTERLVVRVCFRLEGRLETARLGRSWGI